MGLHYLLSLSALLVPLFLTLVLNLDHAHGIKKTAPGKAIPTLLRERIKLPKYSQRPCTIEDLGQIIAPCGPPTVEVIYDEFFSKYPDGCMNPFPVSMLTALVNLDFTTLMEDKDVKWLMQQFPTEDNNGGDATPGDTRQRPETPDTRQRPETPDTRQRPVTPDTRQRPVTPDNGARPLVNPGTNAPQRTKTKRSANRDVRTNRIVVSDTLASWRHNVHRMFKSFAERHRSAHNRSRTRRDVVLSDSPSAVPLTTVVPLARAGSPSNDISKLSPEEILRLQKVKAAIQEAERHPSRSKLSIYTNICPLTQDQAFIDYALSNSKVLGSKYGVSNGTHLFRKNDSRPELARLALSVIGSLNIAKLKANYTKSHGMKVLNRYALHHPSVTKSFTALGVTRIGEDAYQHAGVRMTSAEVLSLLVANNALDINMAQRGAEMARKMFQEEEVTGRARALVTEWDITKTGERRSANSPPTSLFRLSIAGKQYFNVASFDLLRMIFERQPLDKCIEVIHSYRLKKLSEGLTPLPQRGPKETRGTLYDPDNLSPRESLRLLKVMQAIQEERSNPSRSKLSIHTNICPMTQEQAFIDYALSTNEDLSSEYGVSNDTDLSSVNDSTPILPYLALQELADDLDLDLTDLKANYTKYHEIKVLNRYMLHHPSVKKNFTAFNVIRLDDDTYTGAGVKMNVAQLLKFFHDNNAIDKRKLLEEAERDRRMFEEETVTGPVRSLVMKWNIIKADDKSTANGPPKSLFQVSIKGEWYYNVTSFNLLRMIFERQPLDECIKAIRKYRLKKLQDMMDISPEELRRHTPRPHPSPAANDTGEQHHTGQQNHTEERGMNASYTLRIIGQFMIRKFVANGSRCGPGGVSGMLRNLTSFTTLDHAMSFVPMFAYMKNAIIRKYVKAKSPVYKMITEALRELFKLMGMEFVDLFAERSAFAYRKFPIYASTYCRFSDFLGKCMNKMMVTAEKRTACVARWPEMKPFMDGLPLHICTRNRGSLVPSPATLRILKANYGFIFNFLGCFVNADGSLPFTKKTGDIGDEMAHSFFKSMKKCHLEKYIERLVIKLTAFAKSYERRPMDIMKVIMFVQEMTGSMTTPLRCIAKVFHQMCAPKNVNLGVALSQILPMMEIASFGIISMSPEKVNYNLRRSFKTKDRVTLMVVGDPHVRSLKSGKVYETCNSLEYFNTKSEKEDHSMRKKREITTPMASVPTPMATAAAKPDSRGDGLVAEEKIVLLSNEFFELEGTLARWSSMVNGTFFKDVTVSVTESSTLDGDRADKYVYYTFDAKSWSDNPRFTRVTTTYERDEKTQVEEIVDAERLLITGTPPKKLSIGTKLVKGEKRVFVKESKSGTLLTFSNSSGNIVNIYARSSRSLLEVSTGLLIEGCSDSLNRSEVVTKSTRVRRRRAVDCTSQCGSVETSFNDMCLYDCMAADISNIPDTTVTGAYAEIDSIVTDVEAPAADDELISEAVEEAVSAAVQVTSPSPQDTEASGGSDPVQDVGAAVLAATQENIAEDNERIVETITPAAQAAVSTTAAAQTGTATAAPAGTTTKAITAAMTQTSTATAAPANTTAAGNAITAKSGTTAGPTLNKQNSGVGSMLLNGVSVALLLLAELAHHYIM